MIDDAGKNKVRMLKVYEIMCRTDEKHPMNNTQICEELKRRFDIDADRKAVGRDLKCISAAGYEIMRCDNHNDGTYMVDQPYEDYELKILADAVCSARFLTEKDTEDLLNKIKNTATYEGEEIITNTAFFDKNLKSDDKQNKNKIDKLIRAIRAGKKINFKYYEIGGDMRRHYKRNGHVYNVSPYFLALFNNEYFLIANSQSTNKAIHFRIEMIDELAITDEPARKIKEIESFFDEEGQCIKPEEYLKNALDMWSGKQTRVTLECKYDVTKDIQNTFGKNVKPFDRSKATFKVRVPVIDNQGFYHWLAGKGTSVKIIAPEKVRTAYCGYLKEIADIYSK